MLIKNKQRIIHILIIIFSYGYIAFRLSNISNDTTSIKFNNSNVIDIIMALILSGFNILIEAIKWKVLISPFHRIKVNNAIKMVVSGFSTGIFTPAKLGEPYGRVIFLPNEYRMTGTILNYLGGAFQNIIILLWGISFLTLISLNSNVRYIIIIQYLVLIITITILIFILLYSIRNHITIYLSKYKWTKKILESLSTIKQIKLKNYLTISFLSMARYLIYCGQLITLLYTFSDSNFDFNIIFWVPIYFMCITLIPSFLLADIGVRNSVAFFLFNPFFINELNIFLPVSILWFINQVIPALLGSIFIFKRSIS